MSIGLLMLATVSGILLILASVVPAKWRFLATIMLSVPQLYLVPISDFYLSLAFVSSLFLWPEAVKEAKFLLRQKAPFVVLALMVIQAISLLWSSDLRLGLHTLVYTLPFFLLVAAACSIARTNFRFVYTAIGITCAAMVLQLALVVAFRLYPALQIAYFYSKLSGVLSNPNVIAAFLDDVVRFNVLDPDKSGGVFVNGNVAAAYLGMGAFAAFLVAKVKESKLLLIVAACLMSGVFFTGSKAAMILAVVLPLAGWGFTVFSKYNNRSKVLLIVTGCVVAPVAIFSIAPLIEIADQKFAFMSASIDTASVRLQIWRYAAHAFPQSPIFGQGFGGWQRGYGHYALSAGLPQSLPPHNTLIYLWSQSGMVAASLGFLFMFYVLKLSYQLTLLKNREAKSLGWGLSLVAGWLFIQGMGSNWGLLGEPHQQALLAALIGLGYAALQRSSAATVSRSTAPAPLLYGAITS